MKVLNLYAGIGGNRKLWDNVKVTAVEYDQATADVYKSYFPDDTVIVADAHQYLLDHYKEFDFIWSSPPCPTHSDIRRCAVRKGQYGAVFPDMQLYEEIILLKHYALESKWVVENVIPYYEPLINPTKKMHRHLFWTNFRMADFKNGTKRERHNYITTGTDVYGFDVSKSQIKNKRKALRNMVDPELGLHIFNYARGILSRSKTEQQALFT